MSDQVEGKCNKRTEVEYVNKPKAEESSVDDLLCFEVPRCKPFPDRSVYLLAIRDFNHYISNGAESMVVVMNSWLYSRRHQGAPQELGEWISFEAIECYHEFGGVSLNIFGM
jgi:hypothetical protein